MANVTYLLGAGASAGALPTTQKIKEDFPKLPERIDSFVLQANELTTGIPQHLLLPSRGGHYGEPFTKDLLELSRIAADHPSLDTYARMLFFRTGSAESKDLLQYKALVACCFLLLQAMSPIDQRYDLFWASILTRPKRADIAGVAREPFLSDVEL